MTKTYRYCEHTEVDKHIINTCLDIGDNTYLIVCQSCFTRLQNYFVTQYLSTLVLGAIEDGLLRLGK